jgi:phosphatidylserine/phosphatidylglycerophosphate/cardiolipin synthase-like enzyme
VKLIVQPDDGLEPVLQAIRKATDRIDILIFRLDRDEVVKALGAAVAREVPVRALIAHTARGDEKRLRKLEQKLVQGGAIVARTADDLPRYHGKMLIADDLLHVLAFNYTKADVRSRSFGVIIEEKAWIAEARRLFEADFTKQPYEPKLDRFIVSPENARRQLADFINGAKEELLIYDHKVSDRRMIRLLLERSKAGVDVRVLGNVAKEGSGLAFEKVPRMRQHVRAIVRDGAQAFIGSQSLRALELDGRREVGVIVEHAPTVKQMRDVFEADWETTDSGKKKKKAEEKEALGADRSA